MEFLRQHKEKIMRLISITRFSIRYYEEIETTVNYLIGLIYKRRYYESI